jgi:nucleoside-diphosphate-sugar epimerase
MAKLIFGCGYLGLRVARLWAQDGRMVMVVTRSADRSLELAKEGLFTIGANVTNPKTLECLRDLPHIEPIDTVLFAVGFDRTAGQSIQDVYEGGLRNVLEALPATVGRIIYISTTGVYGDAGGAWIDEQTPPEPQRIGGRASLAAERVLAEHPFGANSVILRLAGLYGPGRVPYIDQLRAGEPVAAPTVGALNLIHVDDAAQVVLASDRLAQLDDGPRVYCVSDGQPVERGEYIHEVARCLGAPSPMFVASDAGSPRAARAETNRRIRNARMLRDLHNSLVYPNYLAGLRAILAAT